MLDKELTFVTTSSVGEDNNIKVTVTSYRLVCKITNLYFN